ncbi:hypothetical protein CsSME_00050707 [Camellia sinensis var. sinensis]
MDPKLTEISQLFERFKAAFIRNDFDTCSKLLSQLKVLLTEFRSLPPLFEETPNAVHELTLASNLLDLSIKYRDMNREANPFIAIPLCWFLNFISSVVLNLACELQVALAVSMLPICSAL